MYTENYGEDWTMVRNLNAKAIGFGAPENEGDYPVIYAIGNDNVSGGSSSGDGIYRSIDKGESWQRINDGDHLFGNITPSITGDGVKYGRVYFATNGRGIVMGDIAE